MRTALTFGLAAAVLTATLSYVVARSRLAEPEPAAVLPAHDMLERVRAMGLEPLGAPARQGQYYVVQAYDIRGRELRVVADVQYGDILSAAPVPAVTGSVPQFDRGPRIIRVPLPGERGVSASVNSGAQYLDEDEYVEAAPPRPRVTPKPQRRSDAPATEPRCKPYNSSPPSVPRRTVLSAPPLPAETSLTPIRPTPRFGEKPVRQITGATRLETGVNSPPAPPLAYTAPAAPEVPSAQRAPPQESAEPDVPQESVDAGETAE